MIGNTKLPPELRWGLRGVLLAALAAGGCRHAVGPDGGNGDAPTESASEGGAASSSSDKSPKPRPRPGDAPSAEAPDCDASAFAPGMGLKPSEPVDAVLLRRERNSRMAENITREVLGADGKACAGVSDPKACKAALVDAWPEDAIRRTGFQTEEQRDHLVATRGDTFLLLDTEAKLRDFLGAIDAPGDAATLAWALGYDAVCPAPTADGDGFTVHATRRISDCPVTDQDLVLRVSAEGQIEELSKTERSSNVCVGRLPDADLPRPPSRSGAAGWLAEVAELEALAVDAFAQLHRELRAHGAPNALIAACEDAMADEARHAEQLGAIARSAGCAPQPIAVAEGPARSLAEIARHNAEEGLARETWGALVGMHQAQHARWPGLAAVMAGVAEDEVRHAELSWALHRWIWPQLTAAEQARVAAAFEGAWAQMASEPVPDFAEELGLPAGLAAVQMREALRGGLRLAA